MAVFSRQRRQFLSALGIGAAALPLLSLPRFVSAAGGDPSGGNILILVELSGGNDGLNTVVPIADPAYRNLRPDIGVPIQDGLSIDVETALHPAMPPIADLWERGEVQIIEGVGYPDPNRSHFRSIEIWDAGSGAQTLAHDGWIASSFGAAPPRMSDAEGLVLGGSMGPLSGAGRFSAMRDEETFVDTFENLPDMRHAVRPQSAASPLEHVLRTYESAQVTGDLIRRKLERSQ